MVVVLALLFAATSTLTIVWCESMSAMGEMPMPGGWTMSMVWMRMPGQTWPGAAASFLGMWVVMMVAMMLPSLAPMLWRYRLAVGGAGETPLGRLTALVGVGYFFVWTAFGMAAFPLGVALAAVEMHQPPMARAVPIAIGVVVLIAEVGSETLALTADAVDVDAVSFERLVQTDDPATLGSGGGVLPRRPARGAGLPGGAFEDWLMPERERLRELAVDALARVLAHQRSTGDADAALRTALRLVALEPLQESVHRTLMRLYAELGRRGAALRQYQLCVGVLNSFGLGALDPC